MNEDKLYQNYEKTYNSFIKMTNSQLKKEFENTSWNFNIQLLRYCEYRINNLQQENKQKQDKLDKIAYIIKFTPKVKSNFTYSQLVKLCENILQITKRGE